MIFAVKPQNIPELLDELRAANVMTGKVIVSIAAGVPIKTFTAAFGDLPVVRTMPNTPMLIGAGVTGTLPQRQSGRGNFFLCPLTF